ncbi:hypothetical protein [Kitasatospora sp. NPDC059571]|uniref:hypothetical protein n=1 Tax=Kitasatospora sp. NPDC059571 TaxID=3346871 RepID=UPI0036B5AA06
MSCAPEKHCPADRAKSAIGDQGAKAEEAEQRAREDAERHMRAGQQTAEMEPRRSGTDPGPQQQRPPAVTDPRGRACAVPTRGAAVRRR